MNSNSLPCTTQETYQNLLNLINVMLKVSLFLRHVSFRLLTPFNPLDLSRKGEAYQEIRTVTEFDTKSYIFCYLAKNSPKMAFLTSAELIVKKLGGGNFLLLHCINEQTRRARSEVAHARAHKSDSARARVAHPFFVTLSCLVCLL